MSHQSYSELVQNREVRAQRLRGEFEKSLQATLDHEEMVALQRDLAMEVRHILRHFHYENALPTLPHRLDITTGSMIQPKVEHQVEAIALTAFVWTGRKTIAYYIVKNAGQCNLFRGLVSNTGSENPFRLSIGLTATPDQLPSHQKISVEHLQIILAAMRKLQDSQPATA